MGARPVAISVNKTVTVADGATVSGAADISGKQLVGVVVPTGLEGTTLGFQVSTDGVTYYTLHSGGSDLSITVAASRYVALNPDVFLGVRYVKLVLATQTGAIVLTLVTR